MMGLRYLPLLAVLSFSAPLFAEAPAAFERGMNALLEGNFAEAYCQWKPLAQKGYAEAQYNLGWLYANGNGMNVDMQQAFYWWKKAANQGHADAEFALGLSYATGEGVKRDLETAAQWFYMAARRGHADARDSLLRIAGDKSLDLLKSLPQLASEPWFEWTGQLTSDRINVRAGPGTNHRIVAQLAKGQAVKVLGQRDKWLKVVLPPGDSAQAGAQQRMAWVYHSLLKPVGPNSASL
jgi:TPR repeat protein